MTEEERLAKEKADAARADAEPEWAKKLSAKCDAVMTRMDSMPSLVKADTETAEMAADKKRADEEKERADKARADAEEKERADKARADAEEKERADKARADEEKAKADAAKADAEKEEEARADAVRKQVADAVAAATAPLQSQLAALTGAVHINDKDRDSLEDIQARADSVLAMQGTGREYRAPQPMAGETPINYRRRLATMYKVHSPTWKDRDMTAVADSILDVAEEQIYADMARVSSTPATAAAGTLRQVVKKDRTGREITEFVGDKSVWMDQFRAPAQLMVKIDKEA